MYVTACDLKKSFVFDIIIKIIGYVHIRFLDPDFVIRHAISALQGRFLLILNVHHISTSALVDLLT